MGNRTFERGRCRDYCRATRTRDRRVAVGFELSRLVAVAYRVSPAQLSLETRGQARTALARQVAMYLIHVTCGLNLTEVGRMFGRDRTTVAYACQAVEMRRDEPKFDHALAVLEAVASLLISRLPGPQSSHREAA